MGGTGTGAGGSGGIGGSGGGGGGGSSYVISTATTSTFDPTNTSGPGSVTINYDPVTDACGVATGAADDYSYAAGGATGGSTPTSGSGADGSSITLAANTFTYPGYTSPGGTTAAPPIQRVLVTTY
jgi:hypothetical protein